MEIYSSDEIVDSNMQQFVCSKSGGLPSEMATPGAILFTSNRGQRLQRADTWT